MFVLCTLECVSPMQPSKYLWLITQRHTPPSLETVNCQKCHPVSRFLNKVADIVVYIYYTTCTCMHIWQSS
jgi:hypothetical protein